MTPVISPGHRRVLGTLTLILFPVLWTGCADKATEPPPQQPGDPVAPVLTGAIVPEAVEEGSEVVVEVWGDRPAPTWVLDRIEVHVAEEGVIVIRPLGHLDGSVPPDQAAAFQSQATFAAPVPGVHTVRVEGAGQSLQFPMHVFPRHAIVRLLVRGGPDRIHEELAIGADGWAIAFRRGVSHPVRIVLPPEQIEAIRAHFARVEFFRMEDRYIGDHPNDALFFDLIYREGDRGKRVIAEETAAPEPLLGLVLELRRLAERIIGTGHDHPPIVASIRVDPVGGDATVERRIVISLANRSEEVRTIEFPTAQIFDIVILAGRHMGDHPPTDPRHPVWNWAYGQVFPAVITHLEFAPREVKRYEATWSCVTNEGETVEDGAYRVVGVILGRPHVPMAHGEVLVGRQTPPPPGDPLRLVLSVEPLEATPGSPRAMVLTIANTTERPITLRFPTEQQVDFEIHDPRMMRPRPLWRWSVGQVFGDLPTELTVLPRERMRFAQRWNGRTNDGEVVGPGTYVALAHLTTREPRRAAPVRVHVIQ